MWMPQMETIEVVSRNTFCLVQSDVGKQVRYIK